MARRTILATIIAGILALGATPAGASHALQAEHAPPALVSAGQPLEIQIAAASSCVIAYCSWVQVEVHYTTPDGRPAIAWNEGPYDRPVQLIPVTIPAEHVVSPAFDYRVVISQQDCIGDCHTHSVTLPRMGGTYRTRVDG